MSRGFAFPDLLLETLRERTFVFTGPQGAWLRGISSRTVPPDFRFATSTRDKWLKRQRDYANPVLKELVEAGELVSVEVPSPFRCSMPSRRLQVWEPGMRRPTPHEFSQLIRPYLLPTPPKATPPELEARYEKAAQFGHCSKCTVYCPREVHKANPHLIGWDQIRLANVYLTVLQNDPCIAESWDPYSPPSAAGFVPNVPKHPCGYPPKYLGKQNFPYAAHAEAAGKTICVVGRDIWYWAGYRCYYDGWTEIRVGPGAWELWA